MAKKIWYSKPLSEMWSQYNKFYRQSRGSLENFFKEKNRQIYTTSFSYDDIQCHTSILDLWYLDTVKKFTHLYFKNKELRDFLANMKLADLDGIIDFLLESGEEFYFAPSFTGEQVFSKPEKIKTYNFGIHIPYEKEEKGYAFQLLLIEKKELKLIWAVGKNEGWCSADNYKFNLQHKSEYSEFFTNIFRLAINTIAYMKVFPECVKEGPPPTEKSECSYVLETSEKIIESISNGNTNRMISPHFRKGYFKRLKSDFYTHKKGQLIFVSETMVNGNAKTIEKSNDENKLNEFKNKGQN